MEPTSHAIGKAIGQLCVLGICVLLIKVAFEFTWFQGFVLGYLYWLLRDACLNSNK